MIVLGVVKPPIAKISDVLGRGKFPKYGKHLRTHPMIVKVKPISL